MKNLSLRNGPRPFTRRHVRQTRRWCAFLLAFCMISYGFLPLAAVAQIQVSGSIHPNAIQIDNSANHHAGNPVETTIKNPGATLDWVKDSLANTDTPSLIDSIATGIKTTPPDQTGAAAIGHWNGVRIVDGIAGGEQDIFLSGGKVNEPASWNIGPGTVGSSKYDATQMYIANNQTDIFFGMERRGNNGTTAFDFEFTQLQPVSTYIPNRSDGDILISFELQGSGGSSGTVQTYIFRFDGDDPNVIGDPVPNIYVPFCDDDPGTTGTGQGDCEDILSDPLITSINGIASTPPPPWGYVNSGGTWVLSPGMERRLFAEAQIPLSLLPGVGVCGGSGFVQIRTRASSALGSDAKDTTKIFEYVFGGPTAAGALTGGCGLNIHYDAAGSTNASGGTTGLTYEWRFEKRNSTNPDVWVDAFPGTGPDATDDSGDILAPGPGTYRATLKVIENTDCFSEVTTSSVTVFDNVDGTASLTADCDDTFTFTAQGTGGSGSYAYEWKFYKEAGTVDTLAGTSSSQSGTIDVDDLLGDGEYYAVVTIRDANNVACFKDVTTNAINVRHPLTVTLAKDSPIVNTNNLDASFSVSVTGTIGNASGDTIVKAWEQFENGTTWTSVGTDSVTLSRTMTQILAGGTAVAEPNLVTILSDPYKVVRTSLQVRLTVSRSLTGQACPVTSDPLTVKAIKAIDP